MILFPVAKINIGLRVTEKRQDGYHNIQSVFYPVPLCDALEFVVNDDGTAADQLTVTGISPDCRPEDNLVIRAISLLRESFPIPGLRIHLHKVIPSGAGLGGGSSDAAAIMCGLNSFLNLGISDDRLKQEALRIGSDCPFFVGGKPVYAEGRGEITTPVSERLKGYHLVIAKPEVNVSTREAYGSCIPAMRDGSEMRKAWDGDIESWRMKLVNDFEESIFIRYPETGRIKDVLYESGAVYSSMSGSGSSVFGIFSSEPRLPDELGRDVIFSGTV